MSLLDALNLRSDVSVCKLFDRLLNTKTLLRISEHFSEGLLSTNLHKSTNASVMLQFTQGKAFLVFCFVYHFLHSLFIDFSFD